MMVPASGSKLEAELRGAVRVGHGVMARHHCQVGVCTFRVMPGLLPRERLCICVRSLQYHVCSSEKCTIAAPGEGGAEFCPISGAEIRACPEVYYPARAKGRGSWLRPFSHTMTPEARKRRPRKAKASLFAKVYAALTNLLLSETAVALRVRASREPAASVASGGDDAAPMTQRVRRLAQYLVRYMERVCVDMKTYRDPNALVSAFVSFFVAGLETGGVTLIPRVPWVAELAPRPQDYGKFPGVQCRPLSAASRGIKRALHTSTGVPDVSKAMDADELLQVAL